MSDQTIPQAGMLPKKPKLSVCMIVCDEERMLPRCLKSVQGVAHELVVVDTGSKDNTISIAKDFGAKVCYFEWCDDFAAARNESLKHATGDWILQIDADEELLPQSRSHLMDSIRKSGVLAYSIRCDNGPECSILRYHWFLRLFRRHPKIRYHRPCHENLDQGIKELLKLEPFWSVKTQPDVIIWHYGYNPSSIFNKAQRGIALMTSYLESNPDDAYMMTRLGNAYLVLGRYSEAKDCFKKALGRNPYDSHASYFLGFILKLQNQPEAAARLFRKAVAADPYMAEAYASLAEIHINRGLLHEAISELKSGLQINPGLDLLENRLAQAEAMLDNSISGLKSALHNQSDRTAVHNDLGLCYVSKGLYDAGIEEFKKAIAINPGFAKAHMNLGMAYIRKGMMDEALVELNQALSLDANYSKAHYNLAILHYKKGNHEEAIKHCDRAMELGADIPPQFLELLKPHR